MPGESGDISGDSVSEIRYAESPGPCPQGPGQLQRPASPGLRGAAGGPGRWMRARGRRAVPAVGDSESPPTSRPVRPKHPGHVSRIRICKCYPATVFVDLPQMYQTDRAFTDRIEIARKYAPSPAPRPPETRASPRPGGGVGPASEQWRARGRPSPRPSPSRAQSRDSWPLVGLCITPAQNRRR